MAAEAEAVAVQKVKRQDATKDRVWREVVSWFWVIVAFLLIEGTLVQARVIPSGSMENTVLIGDHLIVSRIGYDAGIPFTNVHVPLWRNPKRQQIMVFRAPLPNEGQSRLHQASHWCARRPLRDRWRASVRQRYGHRNLCVFLADALDREETTHR